MEGIHSNFKTTTQHVNFLHMLNQPYGFEGSRGGVNFQNDTTW